jgi:hypothetical protein
MTTGGTNAIGRRMANYACDGAAHWLWGSPSRSAEPWTIYAAPIDATSLTDRDTDPAGMDVGVPHRRLRGLGTSFSWRHRLRRQPQVFEGVLMAEVVHRTDDLPVTKDYDQANGRLDRDPAGGAAPPAPAKEHNTVISHTAKLPRLDLEVSHLRSIRIPELSHPLVTPIDALGSLDQPLEDSVPLDGRVHPR